ncbi:MAG: UvrB/UvrC motif-containing protein [Puniceicoccales bacterium]|nr:UvrB/UvrC motif-containing protein [Puniceicoccales bacterium]
MNGKCHFCGKPAAVHVTQIVNDGMQDVYLCGHCAQKHNVFDPDVSHLSILKDISGSLISKMQALSFSPLLNCTKCGFSLSNYKETGLVGCPECYSEMYSFMIKSIENLQKSTEYLGKIPKNLKHKLFSFNDKVDSCESLKEELKCAIAEERYEDAARIRDKLRTFF